MSLQRLMAERGNGAQPNVIVLATEAKNTMKKILYIDMDNVLVDFPSAFPKITQDALTAYEDRLDEVPGIFSLMEPMPGAIDAYKHLTEVFDVYILSNSPWGNPSAWADKLVWVKDYLGSHAYKRLILSHHKNLNIGHFLVDDRLKNGADKFQGEHIHFGTPAFPDWNSVLGYLLPQA
jgi:5'-nucleotidase